MQINNNNIFKNELTKNKYVFEKSKFSIGEKIILLQNWNILTGYIVWINGEVEKEEKDLKKMFVKMKYTYKVLLKNWNIKIYETNISEKYIIKLDDFIKSIKSNNK